MLPEDMMNKLFAGYDIEFAQTTTPHYRCDCSRERSYKAIASISRKDIEEMIADNEPIEVGCHFCNKKYHFSVDDLKEMLTHA